MEITIDKLVYGGFGLGRSQEGKAVFVPFVLPGERVSVNPVQEKKGHMHAELVEILQASEKRVQPFCKHFGVCGGCSYQMLTYAEQLLAKQAIVMETLVRSTGLENPPVREIMASPDEKNYRNQMAFQILESGKTGFYQTQSRGLLEIEECFLPQESMMALREALTLEDPSGLEWVDFRSGDDDPLVFFHGDDVPPELEVDFPINLLFEQDGTPMILSGDEFILKTLAGRTFRVSGDAHFQVNDRQTERLIKLVMQAITPAAGGMLLDVYCGVGLLSAFVAPLFTEVIGIEAHPLACEDYAVNLDEFENVSLYQGAPEAVLPTLKIKPDVMIVAPPRSGIDRFALDAILPMGPKRVIYVSADLATLARDLKRFLQAGYTLESVQPMDMLPHTQHIECVVILNK